MTPRFDPTRAIVYDLAAGQLRDDEGAERLNLPLFVVLRLCEQAGAQAAADFGGALGSEVGRRIAKKLDQKAAIEAWLEHLGGHLALMGFGRLQLERWGRALVLRVEGLQEGASELVGHVLSGVLQRALGRKAHLVAFAAESGVAYLVLNEAAASRARALREAGEGLGQVVEQLHRGAA